WTARAIGYRIKNNIDQNTVALAVVVQEMVDAESSGILFTANPINGHRDEMVINAAWGLGEAIVGGLVSPDTIIADKATGKIKKYEVAEKTVITVLMEKGTREDPLNDVRRKSRVLKDAQVSELISIARKIESFYSKPQDIEWCNASGNFYIVQSRPITALPPEPIQWPLPRPKLMLARGSLAEHLPNAVSPLFGTLGLRQVNKATLELSDFMGGVNLLEAEYQYRVINGYVYFGFLMNAKFMWAMIKVSFSSLGLMFGRSKERWLEARARFANAIAPWARKQVENLSSSELLEGVRALMYAAGKYYTVIQSSTLPSSSMSEIVFTSVYKMVSRKNDPKAETLLLGLGTVPLRAEKSLFDLGLWMRERPALRNLMLHTPTEELIAALQADSHFKTISVQEWDEFTSHLEKHSDEFGHTSFEFDFMNPTPAETPELILDSIKMYVEGKGSDPYARQCEAVKRREQTVKKIRSRFKLIPNRWFDKALKWAMESGPAREDSLADMGMGHTTVRRMLGELGKRFVANSALENAEDIYWLVEDEVNELASMLERSEKLPDYSDKIPARKAEWREQMKLVPPAILPEKSGWAKLIPWARKNESGNVIKGLGASAGKVTATACVMFTPEDFHKMKPGDVLVAVTTTPAWTPLFTMASAVVTDIGGPLSHSSIVAREYGIPAVLATGVGTRRIKDGQIITVDGGAGTVMLDAM
ncbi:MAG TPA: PEP/pyruvate-binding domain-containing protein, partial [Anaerolineales bacterium]|nr:PEP/pyruvate-binding domain-containing protein [Anaerolineales bacterium]